MPAAETQTEESELKRVERWRADALERAGFDPRSAAKLAARLDVDVHYAIQLVQRGCPHELALQILL